MSPNSTDNTTLEVRKQQNLVSRFGIWILSYSVFVSEFLESINFCFKILSEHRVPSFEEGKKPSIHTIPFSIHFGRNKTTKPTKHNSLRSLPPPKHLRHQNHNIFGTSQKNHSTNQPTSPLSGGWKLLQHQSCLAPLQDETSSSSQEWGAQPRCSWRTSDKSWGILGAYSQDLEVSG